MTILPIKHGKICLTVCIKWEWKTFPSYTTRKLFMVRFLWNDQKFHLEYSATSRAMQYLMKTWHPCKERQYFNTIIPRPFAWRASALKQVCQEPKLITKSILQLLSTQFAILNEPRHLIQIPENGIFNNDNLRNQSLLNSYHNAFMSGFISSTLKYKRLLCLWKMKILKNTSWQHKSLFLHEIKKSMM